MSVKEEILINIDGHSYLRVADCPQKVVASDYVIVRTRSAGAFVGRVKSRDGMEVVLTDARRLWYWEGAASLSQMAMEGVSKPDACKFPCAVSEVLLLEVIEILSMTIEALASIRAVPEWSA